MLRKIATKIEKKSEGEDKGSMLICNYSQGRVNRFYLNKSRIKGFILNYGCNNNL